MFGRGVAKIEKGKRKYRAITRELNTCKDTHVVALNAPLLCHWQQNITITNSRSGSPDPFSNPVKEEGGRGNRRAVGRARHT